MTDEIDSRRFAGAHSRLLHLRAIREILAQCPREETMKVFLGSSSERLNEVKRLSLWVEEAGHEAWPWNKPGLFPLGRFTFETLNEIKDKVDAALFIFGADDRVWYRQDTALQPRDNVLIEYGLFAGVLEPSRVAICKSGTIRIATDLLGVTYLDLSNARRAKIELHHWFRKVSGTSASVGRARILAFQNKFSMPATNHYWRELVESAGTRFFLLGGSNKSWINQSTERRKACGESIVRIIANGGDVAIVCYDHEETLDGHSKFIRDCVVKPLAALPSSRRIALLRRIKQHLRVAATNDLKYQAAVCDSRIVIMPLLNSAEFKEESLILELSPTKHGEHYSSYESDIVRTVDRCEIAGFVGSRCIR